jgi:Ca2+/H+ antiporter
MLLQNQFFFNHLVQYNKQQSSEAKQVGFMNFIAKAFKNKFHQTKKNMKGQKFQTITFQYPSLHSISFICKLQLYPHFSLYNSYVTLIIKLFFIQENY